MAEQHQVSISGPHSLHDQGHIYVGQIDHVPVGMDTGSGDRLCPLKQSRGEWGGHGSQYLWNFCWKASAWAGSLNLAMALRCWGSICKLWGQRGQLRVQAHGWVQLPENASPPCPQQSVRVLPPQGNCS